MSFGALTRARIRQTRLRGVYIDRSSMKVLGGREVAYQQKGSLREHMNAKVYREDRDV